MWLFLFLEQQMDMAALVADAMTGEPASPTTETETETETQTTEEVVDEAAQEAEIDEQSPPGDSDDEDEAEADEAKAKDEGDAAKGEDEGDKPPKLSRSQRMRRQLEALRAENAELARRLTGGQTNAPAAPKFEEFNGDYDAYDAARIKWAATEAIREASRSHDEQRLERSTTELQAETLREFQASQESARKALKDFDAVVGKAASMRVAPHLGQAIIESDKAGLLQYHLATRPELVHELNSSSPIEVARRIGRLEARLSLPTPKKTTQAPPPPAAVKGGSAVSSPDADIEGYLSKKYGKGRR